MERDEFIKLSSHALEHIERTLGALEHDALDVQLAGDVLTLSFDDGVRFVVNAHSAAGQIWMAAGRTAWHFDWVPERERWVASKNGDELMGTLARSVGGKLGVDVSL
ncbi:MAG: iron donor protein CyaY [Deltaproteobacteria bacterium]|nr:iron donor protein CyaY [Deltaproteobacteria bacterium]MBK8234850.1 iron donor protein CyaY [Deltaproteobacteria bacterium]MBK8719830.1 iron donor protein CyaY [Deltaproteobacteria bacterium]MBP7285193.1 iron donor protein CyaY [Nannocystaceae bacterium]